MNLLIVAIILVILITVTSGIIILLAVQIVVASISIQRGYRDKYYTQFRKNRVKPFLFAISGIALLSLFLHLFYYQEHVLKDILVSTDTVSSIRVYMYQPNEPERLIFQSDNSKQVNSVLSGLMKYECQQRIIGSHFKTVHMPDEEFLVVYLNGTKQTTIVNVFQNSKLNINGQAYKVNSKDEKQVTIYEYWKQSNL